MSLGSQVLTLQCLGLGVISNLRGDSLSSLHANAWFFRFGVRLTAGLTFQRTALEQVCCVATDAIGRLASGSPDWMICFVVCWKPPWLGILSSNGGLCC